MIKANEAMKENASKTSVLAMEFMYKELRHAHVFADGELLGIEEEAINGEGDTRYTKATE